MRIALIQVASPADEPLPHRRARVFAAARDAAGADLIVLPELWGVGYLNFDGYAGAAEPLHGPTVTMAAQLARQTGAHVHVGSFVERRPDGRLHNTAALLAPDGTVVGVYAKVHTFGHGSREPDLIERGERIAVHRTGLGPIGTAICYDLRFPPLWRHLARLGAHVVVIPAAWPAARLAHWRVLTTARAVDNQLVVVGCNAVGGDGAARMGGHSRVVDASGTVLAEAGTGEGLTMCDVDTTGVQTVRTRFPVRDDERPDYPRLALTESGSPRGRTPSAAPRV